MSHICTRKKKHQLVVAQPTNTEDDANLFSRMSNRNTTLRPRARLQSSLSCAWPNLSRVLLPLTFNTILHETAGHQAAPTLLPQIREASLHTAICEMQVISQCTPLHHFPEPANHSEP